MTDIDQERVERILRSYFSQMRQRRERADCPDEESLAGYLGGNLTGKPKEELEAHLAGCPFCVDELVAAHKAMQETETGRETEIGTETEKEIETGRKRETETVPRQLMERAMALVPSLHEEQEFLDLEVRLAEGLLELVRTTGRWVNPPGQDAVAIRGTPQSPQTGLLQVDTEMGRFSIAVEVEQVETGLCDVVVVIKEGGGKLVDGIRVGLVSGVRELASYLTRQGRAVFDRVSLGKYNLPISESGTPVGTIRLSIG